MKKSFIVTLLLLLASCAPTPKGSPEGTSLPAATPSLQPIPEFTLTPTLLSVPSSAETPHPTLDFQTYDLKWCMSDSINDVEISYIDVVKVEAISREALFIAKIFVRNIPESLLFNRAKVPPNTLEYSWEIWIDINGDADTGSFDYENVADYDLSAMHFVLEGAETKVDSIALGTQQTLWEHIPEENKWNRNDGATIEIDPSTGTITITGVIPDLSPNTKISFSTLDYNPGYDQQEDKPDSINMVPPNTACS